MSKPKTSSILRSLPRDKAFYFFTSIGNYTGESADSLEEFTKKILVVSVKSLEFHLYRADFERWFAETLEDNVLAGKIRQLKALNPIGIDLRDRLYLVVSKRFDDLKKPPAASTSLEFSKPKTTSMTFNKPQSTNPVET